MRYVFGKKNLHNKGSKNKKEYDLYDGKIKEIRDEDLCEKNYENWDLEGPVFFFEEDNLNSGGAKNLEI